MVRDHRHLPMGCCTPIILYTMVKGTHDIHMHTPFITSKCAYARAHTHTHLDVGVLGGEQVLLVEGGVDLLGLGQGQGGLTSHQLVLVVVGQLRVAGVCVCVGEWGVGNGSTCV